MNNNQNHQLAGGIEKWRNLIEKAGANLYLIIGIALGAGIRLMVPALADFPIGDGGLFYKMVLAVQGNHYLLPIQVLYNGMPIPFTYPPLAFYLVAFTTDIFNTPLLDVMRWFPAIVLVLSLPVFYFLARSLMGSSIRAGIALMVYALIPRSITWLIKGGGITRSLGLLFFMAGVVSYFLLFKCKDRKYLFSAILASALVCLTHPEAALHSIIMGILMWVFYGRNKEGVFHAIGIAIGTLALTSLWWIPALAIHGFSPFLHASQTGMTEIQFAFGILFISITEEPLMTTVAVLTILGLAAQLAKREWLLPAFFIVPFIVEPRNAPNIATIPTAILAATALSDLILPALANLSGKTFQIDLEKLPKTGIGQAMLLYIFLGQFIGSQLYLPTLLANQVTLDQRNALEWVRDNTPADSTFLIITNDVFLFKDPLNEWFPAITDRKSLTTIQGYEWIDGDNFFDRAGIIQNLQRCDSLHCIESESKAADLFFDHILMAKPDSRLGLELQLSENYHLAYDNQNVLIFIKTSK